MLTDIYAERRTENISIRQTQTASAPTSHPSPIRIICQSSLASEDVGFIKGSGNAKASGIATLKKQNSSVVGLVFLLALQKERSLALTENSATVHT